MRDPSNTVLITGGNGNLGRLISARLLAAGKCVIKFDIPDTELASTHPNEKIITGDIRDEDALRKVLEENRPDAIFHLASLLSGNSEVNLAEAWAINATASFNLLNLSHETGVNQFFFASTAASYGPVDEDPMSQNFPQWPESMYGATKVAVERLGVYFKQKHGLDFRCLRFPLVVSPNAPKTAVSAFPSHAFKAAFNGETFSFPVSEKTGVSTIFLEDVIDSIIDYTAADRSRLSQHVYNLHAYYLSAGMVAEAVLKRFPDFQYTYEPDAAVEHLIASWPDAIDDSIATTDWGWSPAYDFERSANRMCELLKQSS
ncbi:MAG: NAD-dependent epimerase/dehydratase family protein [bacterium]